MMAATATPMPFRIYPGHRASLLCIGLLLVSMLPCPSSAAETASFRIKHLPLDEAKELARSQLSPDGQLSTLASRSLLVVIDKRDNIEGVRKLLKQFDVPSLRFLLNLQLLAVSDTQARLWDTEGERLPGGWKLIANSGAGKPHLIISGETQLRPDHKVRVAIGSIRPVRPDILDWLEQHGVPDTTDIALHPITSGLTLQAGFLSANQLKLEMNPWIEVTQDSEVSAAAHVEILPDLGSTAATLQPPSTVAPMRLNIQPDDMTGARHVIDIAEADTEINLSVGKPIMLLASENQARDLGNALLSKTINGQRKFLVLRLLLEQSP